MIQRTVEYSQPSISMGSTSMDSIIWDQKYSGKRFQKIPKSKTWICCEPGTVYIALTLHWVVKVIHVCVCVRVRCVQSSVQLFATPWTEAHQPPLSLGFPRQEHWSRLSFTSPGDLPNPGVRPLSLVSCVSCTGRRILYHCGTWEAHYK